MFNTEKRGVRKEVIIASTCWDLWWPLPRCPCPNPKPQCADDSVEQKGICSCALAQDLELEKLSWPIWMGPREPKRSDIRAVQEGQSQQRWCDHRRRGRKEMGQWKARSGGRGWPWPRSTGSFHTLSRRLEKMDSPAEIWALSRWDEFWASYFRSCKITHLCCVKALNLGQFVQQWWDAHTEIIFHYYLAVFIPGNWWNHQLQKLLIILSISIFSAFWEQSWTFPSLPGVQVGRYDQVIVSGRWAQMTHLSPEQVFYKEL